MKKIILRAGVCLMTAAIAIACTKKVEVTTDEPVAVDKEKIKTEIQAMETAFAESMNKGDASGALVYYAEDVESYEQGEKVVKGSKAVEEKVKKDLAEHPKGSSVSFTTSEIFVSNDANLVTEVGSFATKDSSGTPGVTGNFIALFEKRDGKYVCIRDMGTLDMKEPKKEEKK
jgi:ketosteroid isomerase-like protein